jgi:serine 3-dehydrogenase
MVDRGRGHIINIGSVAGREVYPGGNVYCATKAAVRTLSRSLRIDLMGTGLRVTNIDPGMVETEFSIVRFHGDRERADKVYKGLQPLSPDDIAELAVFCATRPPHVNISDVLVMPTAQASATFVHREEGKG